MTARGERHRRPRVGVNLMWCLPGAVGGSEQYLVRQLVGLIELDEVDLTLFATANMRDAHASELACCTWVVSPHDGSRRAVRVVDENTWLAARSSNLDLIHHGGGTAPRRTRRPYVLTIHDLQYRTFPQYFRPLKRHYLDAVVPGSARRAAVVAVPSEYVRRSAAAELDIDPGRIVVVPHGYEPQLLVERTDETELRRRLGLEGARVLVYPAMTAPHKRHSFLLELMERAWTDPHLRLVLIGGSGLAEQEVAGRIAAMPPDVRRRIVRPGRVDDADRNALLAMAEAMVFPSEYEGFGAPLIEAMALGAPVICSNATCLPEVVGDAAMVRPVQFEQWAGALDDLAARRGALIAAGRRRVEQFTTAVSGRALLGAYLMALPP